MKTQEQIKLHPKVTAIEEGIDGGLYFVTMRYGRLGVVASFGDGWDHVSVSFENRCPTWDEMHYVKGMFFGQDECVVQYHPPEDEYINQHPYCLHMWKPQSIEIPRPPGYMVGVRS